MTADNETTNVTDATRDAEEREAARPHIADRAASQDEADALDGEGVDDDVRRHHKEMDERGAHVEGEGQIP